MASFKMNSSMLITLLMIISYQINGSDSSDERKAKFSFEVFEMIQREFCNNLCDIPYDGNRTSRTLILCLINCERPQMSSPKPPLNESSSSPTSSVKPEIIVSSFTTPSTTTIDLSVIPLNKSSPSAARPDNPGFRLHTVSPGEIQLTPLPKLESPIEDKIRKYLKRNAISVSAWNIPAPISLQSLVLDKLK